MPDNAQYESMRLEICCMKRENEELRGKLVAAEAAHNDEKQRRVYYQDITYTVCNLLDPVLARTVVNGTKDTPSTGVQHAVREVCNKLATAEAALAFEKAENTRWEGVCDELEAERDDARTAARWLYENPVDEWPSLEDEALKRWPWLKENDNA